VFACFSFRTGLLFYQLFVFQTGHWAHRGCALGQKDLATALGSVTITHREGKARAHQCCEVWLSLTESQGRVFSELQTRSPLNNNN